MKNLTFDDFFLGNFFAAFASGLWCRGDASGWKWFQVVDIDGARLWKKGRAVCGRWGQKKQVAYLRALHRPETPNQATAAAAPLRCGYSPVSEVPFSCSLLSSDSSVFSRDFQFFRGGISGQIALVRLTATDSLRV